MIVLGAWILWKLRNDIAFNGASPWIDQALLLAQNESDLWMLEAPRALLVWSLLDLVVSTVLW